MADRKGERERLRQERIAAQQKAAGGDRRRELMGYAIAAVLIAIVIVGIIVVISSGGGDDGGVEDAPENAFINTGFGGVTAGVKPDGREGTPPPQPQNLNLRSVVKEAGCTLKKFPDEGNKHVKAGTKVTYKTEPPTSGNHYEPGALLADGAYAEFPDPRRSVHTLEHGRVSIQYSPELPEDQQLALKGVFEQDPRGMLLFPNLKMKAQVAATAWRNSLTCPRYEKSVIDAIRSFRDEFRGAGPESVPF